MKTLRLIALSLAFISCSLYLSAQRMGMDASQSPFSNQNTLPGSHSPMNNPRGDTRTISGVIQDNQNNGLNDVRVKLGRREVIEILALAGLDFAICDLEHSQI